MSMSMYILQYYYKIWEKMCALLSVCKELLTYRICPNITIIYSNVVLLILRKINIFKVYNVR